MVSHVSTIQADKGRGAMNEATLWEESSQNNVILQYKLLASILSAVCSVIQQS